MKNRMKRLIVLATAATMMTAAFTGCGSSSDGADNNADTSADEGASNENLSGSLSLAGSTSMEKLCEALKESFMEKNPGVTVTVEYTGSGSGIESVTAGSVDIGDSSRALLYYGFMFHLILLVSKSSPGNLPFPEETMYLIDMY